MKTSTIIIGIVLLVGGLFIGQSIQEAISELEPSTINLSGRQVDQISSVTTSASSSVATSSTAVLTANSERVYASITNNSTNEIWCEAGATASADEGWKLVATDASTGKIQLEFGPGHIPYTGAVACIAETAASNVSTVNN